jgi:hypothetical protein
VFDEESARYRGLDYVTSNDTVGYETLGILEEFTIGEYGAGSAEHYHLLAEAMGHAFADNATSRTTRTTASDPVQELGGVSFARSRAAAIALDRTAPRPIVPAAPWPLDTGSTRAPSAGGVYGTTQVVAADVDGNLVSLITTIGADFGSLVAVPGTGIVLNNSMVNYDPRPGRGNSIAPGKMPFFAVPAIVAARAGRAAFAAAGSGGYPILAGVINTTIGVVDHGLSVQAAIDQPRVHSQGNRTFIDAPADPSALRRLEADLGHVLLVAVVQRERPHVPVEALERERAERGARPADVKRLLGRVECRPLADVQCPDRRKLGRVVLARVPQIRSCVQGRACRIEPTRQRAQGDARHLRASETGALPDPLGRELQRRACRADVIGGERERERARVAARPCPGVADQSLGRDLVPGDADAVADGGAHPEDVPLIDQLDLGRVPRDERADAPLLIRILAGNGRPDQQLVGGRRE